MFNAVLTDDGVVVATGEIDLATAPDLERAAMQLVEGATEKVVIDLSNVTFMDSAGLNVFVRLHKRLSPAGRDLILRSAPAPVRRVLEIGGVPTFATLE